MSVVCSTWDCSNCDQKGILNNLCICSNCGMSRNNWECIKCNKTISRCQECIDCGYVKEDTFKFVKPKNNIFCPICLEEFNELDICEKSNKITFCKSTCGERVHFKCQMLWMETSNQRHCTVCKSDWKLTDVLP
jgi:hypothetical protein